MDFQTYQQAALRTAAAPDKDPEEQLLILTVAWAGEVGEFCNKVKKKIKHGHAIGNEEMAEELGDCLWYAAVLCQQLGLDLNAVAEANIEKLSARYPRGFTQKDSIERRL